MDDCGRSTAEVHSHDCTVQYRSFERPEVLYRTERNQIKRQYYPEGYGNRF